MRDQPFTQFLSLIALAVLVAGCGKPESPVDVGNREQILYLGNKSEPQDLDPHTVEGTGEHKILMSLLEGLAAEDPKTLEPVPGTAERWEISEDGLVYTFYIRESARWSNGDKLTAHDFVNSYKRLLTPSLGSRYAYMLYPIRNAREFHQAALTDFAEVGVKALDAVRLQITLSHPTSYFLSMVAQHYTFWPVHLPTIEKFGDPYLPGNPWTRPGNFVGNGPFALAEWKIGEVVRVVKSETYWDKEIVRLKEIHFKPIESLDAEERAFRAGQLHLTYEVPLSKIPVYRKDDPDLIRIDDYLGTYLYRLNTTRPFLKDVRVRKALSMTVDREAIVGNITRAGQLPAYTVTPPDTAGYNSAARAEYDPDKARALLAEAGYPGGAGFPKMSILYNTSEAHKSIAEAIQQMWKKELGIDTELVNQEFRVYLDTEHSMDYDVSRGGWIGDYPDPYTFLGTFASWSDNNRTGWKNEDYDRLLTESEQTVDPARRYALLQEAERLLLEDAPLIPIYIYTRVYLIQPSVKGWHPTYLDHHPYKHVYLEPETKE